MCIRRGVILFVTANALTERVSRGNPKTHPKTLFTPIFFQLLSESRNLSLNMPKNALFLLKNCKNRRALGCLPPTPLASGG